jgi:hypothetical protein
MAIPDAVTWAMRAGALMQRFCRRAGSKLRTPAAPGVDLHQVPALSPSYASALSVEAFVKQFGVAVAAAVLVALSLGAGPALADWHRGHGGWGWGGGIYLNLGPWWGYPYGYYPYAYPYSYPYPYTYSYPYVAPQYAAPQYVAPAPAAPPAEQSMWYYCRSKKAYYPYVKSCPQAWEQVPTRPTK